MDSELLRILTQTVLNGRFDSIILKDPDYLTIINHINNILQKIEESNFTNNQKLLIDELMSVYEMYSNYYIQVVYCQAYKDCVSLLKEIDLL